MADTEITQWQQLLADAQWQPGKIDGDFGPATLRASNELLKFAKWRDQLFTESHADNQQLEQIVEDWQQAQARMHGHKRT